MDINFSTLMRPKLVRIGDHCYRRMDQPADGVIADYNKYINNDDIRGKKQYTTNGKNHQSSSVLIVEKKFDEEKNRYNIDKLEAEDGDDPNTGDDQLMLDEAEEIITNPSTGQCTLKAHLCSLFFGYVIGKRGQTRNRIESDTGTTIKIPRVGGGGGGGDGSNNGDSFIQIIGRDRAAVLEAKRRIDQLVESIRLKQAITHFVAIPIGVNNIGVRERFEQFKNAILSDVSCSVAKGIDETVFNTDIRLHLTLRALYLGDSYERKQAEKLMKSFKTNYLDNVLSQHFNQLSSGGKHPAIQLQLQGIDIMNDDPTEATVLYAKVHVCDQTLNDLFKKIVNKAYDWFAPLAKGSYGIEHQNSEWKVKLHVTLMNTRWRDQEQSQSQRSPPPRSSFRSSKMDVSEILNKFGQYDFGTVQFDQLHLCVFGGVDTDGYYFTLANISF